MLDKYSLSACVCLKELRFENDLSQNVFARLFGIPEDVIFNYENRLKAPSLELAYNVSVHYGVSMDWILGISGIKYLNSPIPVESVA